MKVLVTGASGFIAGHVIEELHSRGIETIGLVRHIGSVANTPIEAWPDVTYVGDVKDKEVVEKAVNSSDGVINLAGILGTQETINNPYPSVEVNILGALNVLEACRLWKVPLVQIAVGNHWMNNSYSITKTTAERFVQMYVKEHGVKANTVRALNAFGERQKAKPVRKIMASFITRALAGEPIQIYGDGMQKMDMIYVKDVAKILVDTLLTPTTYGNLYEAGTGIGYTVKEIAEKIIELSGSNSEIEYLPMRAGEPPHSEVIAQNPVDFMYTSLEEGLSKTIAWYESQV